MLVSPLNCIGDSSGDESSSSQETIKPPKSRKRISFSPNTLLFSAVSEQSHQEAKMLLESDRDIDVNIQTPSGQTLLHIAAGNADLKCVRLLLKHGGDPNIKDSRGWGPLHAAIRRGKWKCAILLIEAGANFAEYAENRIKEFKEVLSMSRTCYRSMEIFV
jgi:ankyrin repeat protein